jgi:hypothetical protein
MDLAALDAIDVHVHVEQDSHGCFALDQELLDASAKYFHADQDRTPTVATIASTTAPAAPQRWCSPSTPRPGPGTHRCRASRSPSRPPSTPTCSSPSARSTRTRVRPPSPGRGGW